MHGIMRNPISSEFQSPNSSSRHAEIISDFTPTSVAFTEYWRLAHWHAENGVYQDVDAGCPYQLRGKLVTDHPQVSFAVI